VATLKKHGIHANVSHFTKAGHTYYRVRVGPYAVRADADKAAAAVAKAYGGKADVVPNS
jgi:cell division protein FtsN